MPTAQQVYKQVVEPFTIIPDCTKTDSYCSFLRKENLLAIADASKCLLVSNMVECSYEQ